MAIDKRRLKEITDFESLVRFLAEELDWPIILEELENLDDAVFDFTPEELGIDKHTAANIRIIKQIRPLAHGQPWAIYFIDFERAGLNITGLRRVLSKFVTKQRAADATRATHEMEDILFVTTQGEEQKRGVVFAHFFRDENGKAVLRDFSWDQTETNLHYYANDHLPNLRWPEDPTNINAWRHSWQRAFKYSTRDAISEAKELSQVMASLARDVRKRVHQVYLLESKDGPVHKLFDSFRRSLVRDMVIESKDPKLTSFADIFAQTITYGLFTARFMNPDAEVSFGTLVDAMPETNPFLKELFAECLDLAESDSEDIDLDELGIGKLLELMGRAQIPKIIEEFGRQTRHEDPVIHFYEGFLNAYESEQRKRRGVYYTPDPVVSFIVRSVDEILKDEFKLSLGLADTTTWAEMSELHGIDIPDKVKPNSPFVQILDPAVGTGTFLKHVIQVVCATMTEQWKSEGLNEKERAAAWNEYVPESLLPRLHGYELMLAPYAVCHMKLAYYLKHITGYDFCDTQRLQVYLTNALEPNKEQYETENTALAHEANEVNAVKRDQRFTVMIGNPPYSINSCNLQESAVELVEPFRFVDGEKIQERGALKFETILQDDYVKFWGLGIRVLEKTPLGIISMISNNGFLTNRVLRGVRKTFLNNFNRLTFFDLHGNRSKREVCPDGSPDDNVFDINQGVGISTLRKTTARPPTCEVELADLWGNRHSKYRKLGNVTVLGTTFTKYVPRAPYYLFALVDEDVEDEYRAFVALDEAMPFNKSGFVSGRDGFAVDFDLRPLEQRISDFLNPKNSESTVRERYSIKDAGGYRLARRRQPALAAKLKARDIIRRVQHRPFDYRFVAYSEAVLTSPQKAAMHHLVTGDNLAFCLSRGAEIIRGWEHILCTRAIVQHHTVSLKEVNYVFPLEVLVEDNSLALGPGRSPNFAKQFLETLASRLKLGVDRSSHLPTGLVPEDIFRYIYAVFHSPTYRTRYAEFLKIDFPRLPLTSSLNLFQALAKLGGELVALHLMESPKLDQFITAYTGPKNPEVVRVGWSDDTVWLDAAATKKGQSATPGTIGFQGVPEEVWNFHIGGYQVCEKWLKDRGPKKGNPGRVLTDEDIDHYQRIVVALSETIRIMAEIDDVIEHHGGWPDAFK